MSCFLSQEPGTDFALTIIPEAILCIKVSVQPYRRHMGFPNCTGTAVP